MSILLFDSKRDKDLIAAGGFFCGACCVGKPATEQSPDERYCQGCFEFLAKEAEMLEDSGRKAGSWKPRKRTTATKDRPLIATHSASSGHRRVQKGCDTPVQVESDVSCTVTARIKELAGQGLSSRAIEKELSRAGVTISYRTISRRMQAVML